MLFITNVAIIFKGDRFEKNTPIEMTADEAARFGDDLIADGGVVEEVVEVVDDTPIEEMSVDQLKAKAKALGLKATGSKADLLERITLHLGEITN
jgi:hypothetical protein